MMKPAAALGLTASVLSTPRPMMPLPSARMPGSSLDVAAYVRAILSLPEQQLDYARVRLAFEKVIDPSIDTAATMADIDRMAEVARDLAGADANEAAKLIALRKLIYESGPWNNGRPFEYDHDNRFDIHAKLIAAYLETRRGNCVSMPILFLILGERLGLDMALANAPGHYFVRYREPNGRIFNLETTSGAHPAREVYFRQNMPMSDRALANGIYMRSLPAAKRSLPWPAP